MDGVQYAHHPKKHRSRGVQVSVKGPVEDFIDEPGCQRDQYQIGACLLPFVSIIMRQPANQASIQFFRNAGWKRLSSSEVFLNSGWQRRAGTPVVPVFANDPENASLIDTGAMTPIAASGVFAFAALIAMDLIVLRFSLALSITRISQCGR